MGDIIDDYDETEMRAIIQWYEKHLAPNDSDFRALEFRESLRHTYALFIALYAITWLLGVLLNIGVLCYITCHSRSQLMSLLLHLAASHLIKLVLVMPLTLVNLLLKHWLMGELTCYLLPMLQALPSHACTLTYVMIAVHRYRAIVDPLKPALPTGACAQPDAAYRCVRSSRRCLQVRALKPALPTGACAQADAAFRCVYCSRCCLQVRVL